MTLNMKTVVAIRRYAMETIRTIPFFVIVKIINPIRDASNIAKGEMLNDDCLSMLG
jgi:hypothetical protein